MPLWRKMDSGKRVSMRGCEVDMTELIRVVDFLTGVIVGLFLCIVTGRFIDK